MVHRVVTDHFHVYKWSRNFVINNSRLYTHEFFWFEVFRAN